MKVAIVLLGSPDFAQSTDAILHRLRTNSILRNISAADLITMLYARVASDEPVGSKTSPGVETVCDLRPLLPETEQGVLSLCAEPHFTDAERLFILQTALRQLVKPSAWLHYALADLLVQFALTGVEAASAPSLMHAMLVLVHGPNEHPARPLAQGLLARQLTEVSPADAVRSGVAAAMSGQTEALASVAAAAQAMQLPPPRTPTRPNLRWLQHIKARFGIGTKDSLNFVEVSEAAEVSTTVVVPGETRTLSPPEGDPAHYIFNIAQRDIEVPPIRIHSIRGGAISFDLTRPGRTQFYVFDRRGDCIEDLSWGACPFRADTNDVVSGRLAIIGDRFSGTMNICHFLLDHLTRVAIYDRLPGPPATLLLSDPHDYHLAMLAAAGLEQRVRPSQQRKFTLAADELLISSNIIEDLRHPAHLGAAWATAFVRSRLARSKARERRLFISRSDTKGRQIVNWEEVEREFADRGFEFVSLARLAPAEQIALFAEASCIVGVHGAGLTNMIFSGRGTRVLELLPPFVATPAYWVLATQLGHRYRALVAEDPEFGKPDHTQRRHTPKLNRRDISVPPDALRSALDALLY